MESRYLTPNEIKEKLSDILASIAVFCEENNICYFLAWGTLIGSVRHKGFIPWDDDIDIWMPRPDFNRFASTYTNTSYQLRSMQTNPDFPLCFAKVCDERYSAIDEFGKDFGLYVDIFPLDGLPTDTGRMKKHIRHIRRWEELWSSQVLTRKINLSSRMSLNKALKVIASRLLHPFLPDTVIQKHLLAGYEKFSWDTAEKVMDFSTDVVFQKKMFIPAQKGLFEGNNYALPYDYDTILRSYYGDYMTLPPENQRINHGIKAKKRDNF